MHAHTSHSSRVRVSRMCGCVEPHHFLPLCLMLIPLLHETLMTAVIVLWGRGFGGGWGGSHF